MLPSTAPARPARPRRVLVLADSPGFTHSSIPLAARTIEELGRKTGAWSTTVSYDPNVITAENLKQYDAIVLDSTVGAFLDEAGDQAVDRRATGRVSRVRPWRQGAGRHSTRPRTRITRAGRTRHSRERPGARTTGRGDGRSGGQGCRSETDGRRTWRVDRRLVRRDGHREDRSDRRSGVRRRAWPRWCRPAPGERAAVRAPVVAVTVPPRDEAARRAAPPGPSSTG